MFGHYDGLFNIVKVLLNKRFRALVDSVETI